MRPFTRLGTILFLLLCWCGSSAFWGQPPPEVPMTQIPHIAPFARDREIADRFTKLAEFSIRLLQWKDTERPSVIEAQRWLKSELYKQTALGGGAKTPALAEAIRMASDGYWSLRGPHLARVQVGDDIEVIQTPRELRLLGDKPYPLPVVLRNGGGSALTVTLKTASRKGSATHSFRLLPGEAAGAFMTLHAEADSEAMPSLEVLAHGRTRPIPLEVSVVQAGRLMVRVLDEEGSVTPARIYLTGSDGRAYRQAGTQARVSNADYGQPFGGDYYFYSGGEFQVDLPPGEATLEVVKGFEYQPVSREVSIAAGGSGTTEVRLQKPFDLRRQGGTPETPTFTPTSTTIVSSPPPKSDSSPGPKTSTFPSCWSATTLPRTSTTGSTSRGGPILSPRGIPSSTGTRR